MNRKGKEREYRRTNRPVHYAKAS